MVYKGGQQVWKTGGKQYNKVKFGAALKKGGKQQGTVEGKAIFAKNI